MSETADKDRARARALELLDDFNVHDAVADGSDNSFDAGRQSALNNAEALKTVLAELVEAAETFMAVVKKADCGWLSWIFKDLEAALAKAKEILK